MLAKLTSVLTKTQVSYSLNFQEMFVRDLCLLYFD